MDIVDRCQIARDDMDLVRQLSGMLSNLQAGTAYLDSDPDLPARLGQEYRLMAEKLDRLAATAQELFSESEDWLKRVEEKAHDGGNMEDKLHVGHRYYTLHMARNRVG